MDFDLAFGRLRLVGIESLFGDAVECGEQLIAVQVSPNRMSLVEAWETFEQFGKVNGVV